MSLSNKIKYLIINADDFGYCSNRDTAIIDLFKQQSISSTSLLINGSSAYQASVAAQLCNLPVGIHLNLTEGRPVTDDLFKIRSLVNSQGLMHGKYGLRRELEQGTIRREHVQHEIHMQINKYKEFTGGKLPSHIDGHQHIHVHPLIVESVVRVAKEYHIDYIRVPNDQTIDSLEMDQQPFYREIVQEARMAMNIFDRHSLIYPKYFLGITLMGKEFTLKNIERCLQMLEKSQTENIYVELMCHPGHQCDRFIGGCGTNTPDEFSQSADREHEYRLLSSRQLKVLFEKYNVQLCSHACMC
ncbi:unnamed protein product [Adineta ricciae]|uniref:Carbohydrate deacetylase n=1 Tax=Adineta ricciae TaxID=249248 RepID=A0A815QB24_ADIRI|nr:unnamed protein product [Adineta ricciae]CAF1655420.1 unnamed protein product [Adineta ricciae]